MVDAHPIEARESRREWDKEKHVVRAFLVQSKSMERIRLELPEGNNPNFQDLFLTKVIFGEKNGDSEQSAGQLTPVGGEVNEGEELQAAVKRETVEETHVRPVSIEHLENSFQRYILTSRKSSKKTLTNQHLFIIDILPSDRAYPLDPALDKMGQFHGLDIKELEALFLQNKYEKDGKTLRLLGNLRPNIPGVEQDDLVHHYTEPNVADTEGSKNESLAMFHNLSEKIFEREVKKRLKVLRFLFRSLSVPPERAEYWLKHCADTSNFATHQNLWQECLNEMSQYPDFRQHFLAAIDLSNFEEETRPDLPEEKEIEAIIRFVYTLLNTRFNFDTYFNIAEKNPKLFEFVTKIKRFIEAISNDESNDGGTEQSLAEKLKNIEKLPSEQLASMFCEAFKLDKSLITNKLDRINKFIFNIVTEGIKPQLQKMNEADERSTIYQPDSVTQITEVANARLGKLLKYAFILEEPQWGYRADGKDPNKSLSIKKRIVFEARRKLALMIVLWNVDSWYFQNIDKTNEIIEELAEDMFTLPQVDAHPVYIGDDKGIRDIVIFPHGDEKPDEIVRTQETTFRKFIPKKEEVSFLVGNEVRTKQLDSAYRKVIVRGFSDPKEVKDLFGRSLTIAEDLDDPRSKEYIHRRETRSIRIEDKMKTVSDMAPILDILERYSQKPGVRILEYKPTPPPGKTMQSNGVGGGGDIRVSKFYIEHTDDEGIKRYEEVQIFSPGEGDDKTSSLFSEHKKKEDDKRYFLDRMLSTKGLRSFLELMFPTTIYGGPIHAMVRGQKDRKNGNGGKPQK